MELYKNKSHSTRKGYLQDLIQFNNFCKKYQLNFENEKLIDKYVSNISNLKKSTQNRKMRVIGLFYNYLKDNGVVKKEIDYSKFWINKELKKDNNYNLKDKDTFFESLDYKISTSPTKNILIRDRAVIALLIIPKLRNREISFLKWDDICIQDDNVVLKYKRNNKDVMVTVENIYLVHSLREYEKTQVIKGSYYFQTKFHGQYSDQSIRLTLKKYGLLPKDIRKMYN